LNLGLSILECGLLRSDISFYRPVKSQKGVKYKLKGWGGDSDNS
jgi:hypothetical protein